MPSSSTGIGYSYQQSRSWIRCLSTVTTLWNRSQLGKLSLASSTGNASTYTSINFRFPWAGSILPCHQKIGPQNNWSSRAKFRGKLVLGLLFRGDLWSSLVEDYALISWRNVVPFTDQNFQAKLVLGLLFRGELVLGLLLHHSKLCTGYYVYVHVNLCLSILTVVYTLTRSSNSSCRIA